MYYSNVFAIDFQQLVKLLSSLGGESLRKTPFSFFDAFKHERIVIEVRNG